MGWTLLLSAGLAAAVILDYQHRWLPNLLTLPLAMLGLLRAAITGDGSISSSAGGLVSLLVVFLILWRLRFARAGDGKLVAAVGAWIGFDRAYGFLVAWILFNALAFFTVSIRAHGGSLGRWWQEQRVSLRGVTIGVLTWHGAHSYAGAIPIALATLTVLIVQ